MRNGITRREFAAAGAASIAALGFGTPANAADKQTLRFIPHADLTILDPYEVGAYITRNHGYMVYDTLFAMDGKFRPQPQMVDTWTASDDKLTYTFELRDGLKFHDGQLVSAVDVVTSLRRWGQRNDAYGQALLAAATAIEPAPPLPRWMRPRRNWCRSSHSGTTFVSRRPGSAEVAVRGPITRQISRR
jgi:peptide/nickel transport system substrate-binding protein